MSLPVVWGRRQIRYARLYGVWLSFLVWPPLIVPRSFLSAEEMFGSERPVSVASAFGTSGMSFIFPSFEHAIFFDLGCIFHGKMMYCTIRASIFWLSITDALLFSLPLILGDNFLHSFSHCRRVASIFNPSLPFLANEPCQGKACMMG